MSKFLPNGPERIVYSGKHFEVIKKPMISGDIKVDFEIARRCPGVRLILVKEDKILLTKEYRAELEDYDYRLPGGKVFNSLEKYNAARTSGKNILKFALSAAKNECLEETGHIIKELKHIHTAKAGATIEWDLFYFIVNKFEKNLSGQKLEQGEEIEPVWKSLEETKTMCLNGQIKEDRTIGVLLKYILSIKK
ncbi:NUDIX domain-containing protein [archaeon]|jgi:ADP-ribose pyrophosphatase|nr:NUDIX domain-containing protein [archaeon]MBT4021945.1 NUDIX domain-containing protein [archaeon]MBT4272262.1 NUDIX domain-containing protein [archaeon]MBT4460798.1 NUDIX domain-containing protein [archaeon]MBT4858366.1 NUDIX domain-containing protein [archaeon]